MQETYATLTDCECMTNRNNKALSLNITGARGTGGANRSSAVAQYRFDAGAAVVLTRHLHAAQAGSTPIFFPTPDICLAFSPRHHQSSFFSVLSSANTLLL